MDRKLATDAGAGGYIVKAVLNVNDLINTIKEHLKKQQEIRKYGEEKVKEFIETRAKEIKSEKT